MIVPRCPRPLLNASVRRVCGRSALFALLAFIGGCGLRDADGFAPLMPSDNFRVIKEGEAYRSAQVDSTTLGLIIETYGIKTVINLRGENEGARWYDNEKAVCDAQGVAHVDVRMSANELPPTEVLLDLWDAFLYSDYPILIHCKAGADRTGAASAIWRMMMLGDSREDAISELSPLYGHFEFFTPEMDILARMFQADREWILNEYTP